MVYSQANCVYVHHMVFICDFNLVETWIPLDMFITFLHLKAHYATFLAKITLSMQVESYADGSA